MASPRSSAGTLVQLSGPSTGGRRSAGVRREFRRRGARLLAPGWLGERLGRSGTIVHVLPWVRIGRRFGAGTRQSTLAPENATTLAHFFTSSRTKAPNSSGVAVIGSAPLAASWLLHAGRGGRLDQHRVDRAARSPSAFPSAPTCAYQIDGVEPFEPRRLPERRQIGQQARTAWPTWSPGASAWHRCMCGAIVGAGENISDSRPPSRSTMAWLVPR